MGRVVMASGREALRGVGNGDGLMFVALARVSPVPNYTPKFRGHGVALRFLLGPQLPPPPLTTLDLHRITRARHDPGGSSAVARAPTNTSLHATQLPQLEPFRSLRARWGKARARARARGRAREAAASSRWAGMPAVVSPLPCPATRRRRSRRRPVRRGPAKASSGAWRASAACSSSAPCSSVSGMALQLPCRQLRSLRPAGPQTALRSLRSARPTTARLTAHPLPPAVVGISVLISLRTDGRQNSIGEDAVPSAESGRAASSARRHHLGASPRSLLSPGC